MFCAFWAVLSYMLIVRSLDARGMKTPFPLLGLFLFRNLSNYHRLSRQETGRHGKLYYSFVFPMNLAWVLSAAAFLAHSIG